MSHFSILTLWLTADLYGKGGRMVYDKVRVQKLIDSLIGDKWKEERNVIAQVRNQELNYLEL